MTCSKCSNLSAYTVCNLELLLSFQKIKKKLYQNSSYRANCTHVPTYYTVPVRYRVEEEVDKPGQGVLVHGVNVGQVSSGEEQH